MEKIKNLTLYEKESYYEGVYKQQLCNTNEENDISIYFSVSNLSECPEDAIIGRDLFDASDYVQTLRQGIKLAKLGYDDVSVITIKEEE
jgi:hypothetical protein